MRSPAKRPAVAIGTVVLLALGAWLVFAPRPERAEPPVVAPQPATPTPAPARLPAATPSPTPTPRPTREPVSHLRVSDFGVGRRVVHRRLEGRTDSFARGEVAWFQTQVQGGRAGQSVRHVWLHDGRVVYAIELSLGGPSWRTQSRATLGRAGPWTLEARDEEGIVLVRTTVRCE